MTKQDSSKTGAILLRQTLTAIKLSLSLPGKDGLSLKGFGGHGQVKNKEKSPCHFW